MKKKWHQAAQGDVLFTRIAALPDDVHEIPSVDGRVIVTHSETGHHHVMVGPPSVVQMFGSSDPMIGYISVRERAVALEHLRSFDTHDPIVFEPDFYEVRRQREWSPEGLRRVED